ncbi:hypothetical protein [Sphingorhabdus sp. 109]|jgi:hypothetical protein|uniref:hypothetical protein n=1 Tax=Sphingorhabdus sp. 109 TaxID=2653173 RepID=UPI0012F3EA7E|nr:hypothetical protein [Sphingorhabdus sp. 109]VWX60609.1 hypothetical protein SPHINGOR109_50583 [Sphingorhabdus sp. 109]
MMNAQILTEQLYDRYEAIGEKLDLGHDLDCSALAVLGHYYESLSKGEEMRAETISTIADFLKQVESNVRAALLEIRTANRYVSFNLYAAFARLLPLQVISAYTQMHSLSGQTEFAGSLKKLSKLFSETSSIIGSIELTASQPKARLDPSRAEKIARLINDIERALIESMIPEKGGMSPKRSFELFAEYSLSARFRTTAKRLDELVWNLPDMSSRRLPSNQSLEFVIQLGEIWSLAKGTQPSAEKNNAIEDYVPPFVRFVYAAWNPVILCCEPPSISTISRYLNSPKPSQT